MKEKLDIGFKVILLAFMLIFLAYYIENSNNGRYQKINNTLGVIDTRTGAIYIPKIDDSEYERIKNVEWYRFNPIENEITEEEIEARIKKRDSISKEYQNKYMEDQIKTEKERFDDLLKKYQQKKPVELEK